jgi:hypothetical protein
MRKLLKNLPPARQLTADEALALADADDLDPLVQAAARRAIAGMGRWCPIPARSSSPDQALP